MNDFNYKVASDGSATITNYTGKPNVVIPSEIEGHPVKCIGSGAFRGKKIVSLTFSEGIEDIREYAFKSCTNLQSVKFPNSLINIGYSAFEGCTGLTSVKIPKNVIDINQSFGECVNLKSIDVSVDNKYLSSQCGVLFNKDKTELIRYPAGKAGPYIIPDSVVRVFYDTFSDCKGLTSIVIPNGVSILDDFAFLGCTGLTSVTIGLGMTNIGSYAFQGCINLASIKIPNGVTSIGDCAFLDCYNLASATIPDSVTKIGQDVFKNCDSLECIKCNLDSSASRWASLYGIKTESPVSMLKLLLDDTYPIQEDAPLISERGDVIDL